MPRTVALLDVDDTLLWDDTSGLFQNPVRYNESLVNALKAQGVLDVWLFTDMTVSRACVEERSRLLVWLKKQGLNPHGVITPNDVGWNDFPPTETLTFMDEGMQFYPKVPKGGDLLTGLQQYTRTRETEIPTLYHAAYRGYTGKYTPGAAFQEAVEFYSSASGGAGAEESKSEEAEAPKRFTDEAELYKHSQVCKQFCDCFSSQYPHSKGVMLDLFLANKPGWVSGVIVADDRDDVASMVEGFRPCPSEPSRYRAPLLSILRVKPNRSNGFTTPQKDYEAVIKAHLDKDPTTHFVAEIEAHIRKLSSWSLFLRSAEDKVNLLRGLIPLLKDSDNIARCLTEWSNQNENILREHRNIFRSRLRPETPTSTQILISTFLRGTPSSSSPPDSSPLTPGE